jgi:hypothetical protein
MTKRPLELECIEDAKIDQNPNGFGGLSQELFQIVLAFSTPLTYHVLRFVAKKIRFWIGKFVLDLYRAKGNGISYYCTCTLSTQNEYKFLLERGILQPKFYFVNGAWMQEAIESGNFRFAVFAGINILYESFMAMTESIKISPHECPNLQMLQGLSMIMPQNWLDADKLYDQFFTEMSPFNYQHDWSDAKPMLAYIIDRYSIRVSPNIFVQIVFNIFIDEVRYDTKSKKEMVDFFLNIVNFYPEADQLIFWKALIGALNGGVGINNHSLRFQYESMKEGKSELGTYIESKCIVDIEELLCIMEKDIANSSWKSGISFYHHEEIMIQRRYRNRESISTIFLKNEPEKSTLHHWLYSIYSPFLLCEVGKIVNVMRL